MQQKCKFSLFYWVSSLILNCRSVHVPKLGRSFPPLYHIVSLNCNELICTGGGEGGTFWYHRMGSITGIFSVYLYLITGKLYFSYNWYFFSGDVLQVYRRWDLYWDTICSQLRISFCCPLGTKSRIMLLLVFMFYENCTTGASHQLPLHCLPFYSKYN